MRYLIACLSFLILGTSLNAQILKPVKWSFSQNHVEGNEFDLIFTAKIDDGWTIYSQFLEK